MTQYVGCDQARDLLDGLVDGELSMADQLAAESHLRWCRPCALRVDDMRLIGASLRMSAPAAVAAGADEDADTAAAMNEALLLRVCAEREQSFRVRVRELCSDMRFLWPALGATAAVALCVGAAASVRLASTAQQPESLAALIATLANPGSERNPLRPANNGVSIPRPLEADAERAGVMLEDLPSEDVIYTIRTVVNRDGTISNFEVLLADGASPSRIAPAGHERAVLDAVQQSRFAPAHTPLGRAVAVEMVWVIAKTTAVAESPRDIVAPAVTTAPVDTPPVPAVEPAGSVRRASPRDGRSTTV